MWRITGILERDAVGAEQRARAPRDVGAIRTLLNLP